VPAEHDQVIAAIEDWAGRGVNFGLATVVGVRGSTYRGLAARQLVSIDGTSVGTVSGGCLDQDLTAVVVEVASERRPRLVEFDLTADDEAVWGWGIGCNGATKLLVEPAEAALELVRCLRSQPAAIAHVISGLDLGSRIALGAEDPDWGHEIEQARADGRHRLVSRAGTDYLLEIVTGQPGLVICGAGHDAVPLVALGAELGFEVTVTDERRQFLSRERFPQVTSLIHCPPAEVSAIVPLGPSTAVVIMSHNYLRDLDYLRSVLGREVNYLGCLGPGERLERMLKDLEAEGYDLAGTDLSRVHGPAGLDIGADGPIEIAWSILAEILAVRRGKRGGPLIDRKGPASLGRVP
jgi:xanthine/CO dehydrogenase XdhC/CoxF family maturation factor